MSLANNTTALEELLKQANNLPDAGEGAAPVVEALEITENGTYTAPNEVDGYSPVTVNVPIPDGYIQPSGELEVTENGTHDVTEYASVLVNVQSTDGDESLFTKYISGTLKMVTEKDLHGITQIYDYSFYNNKIIKSIEIPDHVTSIGSNAFYMTNLESCKLPSSLVSIGVHAFSRCYVLNWGDLVLPDGLQKMENYAFWYNRKMTSVVIPASIIEIKNEVFRYSNTLKTVTVLATEPPVLGTNVFSNTLVEAIYVPEDSVEAYKAATNWSAYADLIQAIA